MTTTDPSYLTSWAVGTVARGVLANAVAVRAEAAEKIAADIGATIFAGVAMPTDLRPPSGGRPPVSAYAEWAARIARAHRTTPGDDHADR